MSAERFHTQLRNSSAHMCIGNGREWKGMEKNTNSVPYLPHLGAAQLGGTELQ